MFNTKLGSAYATRNTAVPTWVGTVGGHLIGSVVGGARTLTYTMHMHERAHARTERGTVQLKGLHMLV